MREEGGNMTPLGSEADARLASTAHCSVSAGAGPRGIRTRRLGEQSTQARRSGAPVAALTIGHALRVQQKRATSPQADAPIHPNDHLAGGVAH